MGPSFKMTGVFIKKKKERERNWDTAIHTERTPGEDEGRNRMVIPNTNDCQQTNQGKGRGVEEGSQLSEGTSSASFDLGLWPPESM